MHNASAFKVNFLLNVCLYFQLFIIVSSTIATTNDLDAFTTWFQGNGGVDHVNVVEFNPDNRGIQCKSILKENDIVLEIPLHLTLHNSVNHTNEQHRILSESFGQNDFALYAILLYEKSKQNDSIWKPYIDVLPKQVRNGMYFNKKEIAEFQNKDLQKKIISIQKTASENYSIFASKCVKLSWMLSSFTYEDFLWAASIIDSRALRFNGVPFLIPFADMFNFMPHSNPREAKGGDFFLKYHILDTDKVTIRSDRDCSENEQLYEDYGDSNDDIYLIYHGFIPENNPFRCVDMISPKVATLPKYSYDLLTLMEIKTESVSTCIPSSGSLGDKMVVFYTIMAMQETETITCGNFIKNNKGKWNDIFVTCGFANVIREIGRYLKVEELELSELTSNALHLIREQLQRAAGDTPTTIEEDEKLLTSAPELSLPINYRLHFKRLRLQIYDKASLQEKLVAFNAWFTESAPSVSSIEAVEDAEYRIGVRATKVIESGSTYLAVPNSIIMDVKKAEQDSRLGQLFAYLKSRHGPIDSFHKLLFFLIQQRLVLGPQSPFWPYIRLLPTLAEMDLPLFWSNQTVHDRLYPSVMESLVLKENEDTKRTFAAISKVEALRDFFPSTIFTYKYYCWAKVILNSRSIWWEGERHLVPMLDFINHKAGPDPTKLHSTVLDASKKYAITNASWSFSRGEQVFENYGQPNHIYFLYHGFSVKGNFHDCVNIDLTMTSDELERIEWTDDLVLKIAQKLYLREKSDKFVTCLSPRGVEVNAWLYLALKQNSHKKLAVDKLLGKPNNEGFEYLLKVVKERLVKYEDYPGEHEATSMFIFDEETLLRTIRTILERTMTDIQAASANSKEKKTGGKDVKTKKKGKKPRQNTEEL